MYLSCSSSDRLLQTLQLIACAREPVSARELAQQLDFPLSSLYRHLLCLSHWGLVQSVGSSGNYCVGPMGLQLAMNFQQNDTLAIQAMPELQRLARASNETTALMVATRQQVICVAMIESQQALCCSFSPGKGQPLVRGASALSLLAFMPSAQSQATLDAMVPQSEHAELLATLEAVRKQGFAQTDSVIDAGIWGVSVPLLVSRQKALGTLTLMAPSERVGERRGNLIEQTRQAARTISNYLSSR